MPIHKRNTLTALAAGLCTAHQLEGIPQKFVAHRAFEAVRNFAWLDLTAPG